MYRVGGTVSGQDFVDREDILKEITKEIPKNNYILVAPRRAGKTSLLEELERRFFGEYITVNFDVTNIHPLTKANVLKHLGRRVTDAYAETSGVRKLKTVFRRGKDALVETVKDVEKIDILDFATLYFTEDPDITDLAKETLELSEKFAKETGKDFILMLDEITKLIRVKGNTPYQEDMDFLWMLRSHMHKKQKTHYIITGSAVGLVKNLYESEDSPFFGTFLSRKIREIDRKSAENLVGRMKTTVKIGDDLLEKILEKTNCWPFYLQAFSRVAKELAETRPDRKITLDDFDEVRDLAMNDLEPHFSELTGKLASEHQKAILGHMALEDIGAVSKISNSIGKPYPQTYSLMKRLSLQGYLERVGEGEFEFLDPLFKEWLKRTFPS